MRLLIGHPPRSIAELIESTGVTRTAISEQLNGLITAGYVVQQMERLDGRGRPRYLYSATNLAMKHLFEGNQDVVVPAIWRAVQKYCGPETVNLICKEVAQDIANYFSAKMTASTPQERLKEFSNEFCRSGHLGHYHEEDGVPVFEKLNCPFISMFDGSSFLCEIDKLSMEKIVGSEVERFRYRLDGAPCCCFRIKKDSDKLAEEHEKHDESDSHVHFTEKTLPEIPLEKKVERTLGQKPPRTE
jgi:predicted ArsR family transcriptional regulator